ncbi:hypothetical protein MCAMS1_02823 [biofilm metagenome]
MPKKRTAAVARDRDHSSIEPWSLGRRGPVANYLSSPSLDNVEAIKRTLSNTPEVVVKVTGGGREAGAAQAHLSYIDRHGELDVHTDDGELLNGKGTAAHLIDDWGLEESIKKSKRTAPEKDQKDKNGKKVADYRGKVVHNIVLSMPEGTPPKAVLRAAQLFARETFALNHRYAMVLHEPDTDPKFERTHANKNPHVHLVVKAVGENKERLVIDRQMLQEWREQFAKALRLEGVKANATPAAVRGLGKSSSKGAIKHHQQRIEAWRDSPQDFTNKPAESEILTKRTEDAINEIVNGIKPEDKSKEILVNTRNNVVKEWLEAEASLRQNGFIDVADKVVAFVKNLPPVKTDYEVYRDSMLADRARLAAAINGGVPREATKAPVKGDDFTIER